MARLLMEMRLYTLPYCDITNGKYWTKQMNKLLSILEMFAFFSYFLLAIIVNVVVVHLVGF